MQKITHGIPRAGLATLSLLCASCLLLAAGSFKQAPPPSPVVPDPPAPVAVEPPSPAAPEAPAPPALDKRQEQQLNRESRKLAKEINKLTLDAASQKAVWRAEQLQQSIAAMKNRYTGDYPELIAAEKELASLQALAGAVPQAMPAATLAPPAEDHKGPSYIDSLASVGLTNLSVDDLIALKIQGVTPEYVRQMKATGFETNVHELIGLKVQGVTPEYIRDIRATGLKPNVHELLEMKVQGVTPDYIRTLQSAGFGELKIHEIIGAKIQGITPEFIQKVHAHGFKDLTFRQLISLKMADVF